MSREAAEAQRMRCCPLEARATGPRPPGQRSGNFQRRENAGAAPDLQRIANPGHYGEAGPRQGEAQVMLTGTGHTQR
jgi:hypothetical protein